MKKWIVITLLLTCLGVKAQTGSRSMIDAERQRISADRSRLEAAFAFDDSACYQRFFVNSCLEGVKARRGDALADLRRQEIVLSDDVRKAKAAEQVQKIENKSSSEKIQQEAENRAQIVKDIEDRTARDVQKNADRAQLQAGEKSNADAAAGRVKSNQNKAAARAAQQTQAVDAQKKYNERQLQSKERQDRYAKEQASQSKALAKPLPIP